MSTLEYILVGHKPVPEPDTLKWAAWMQTANRQVANDVWGEFPKNTRVSTVFLGVDYGFDGRPVLFETMIFGGDHDGEQWRYSTWRQAERMHRKIVDALFAGEPLP